MEKSGFHHIGTLVKTRGIRGGIVIRFKQVSLNEILEGKPVFLDIEGGLVPFFVAGFEETDSLTGILFLEDIDTEEKARLLQGIDIYLEGEGTTTNREYASGQLEGFRVLDQDAGDLGQVTEMVDVPGNPLLVVSKEGRQLYIPLQENLVLSLDRENKTILFRLPEGLLDLNK